MGFLSKLFARKGPSLPQYTLRLAVRGPMGETRHQFVTFEAASIAAAIQHAERRSDHQHVLRWKLLDANGKQVASAIARRARPTNDGGSVSAFPGQAPV